MKQSVLMRKEAEQNRTGLSVFHAKPHDPVLNQIKLSVLRLWLQRRNFGKKTINIITKNDKIVRFSLKILLKSIRIELVRKEGVVCRLPQPSSN